MRQIETNRIIEKRIKNSPLYRDLQLVLGQMSDSLYLMAQCAGDTMNADLSDMISSGGKRLRPLLAYICYRMGPGRDRDILPLMCMLELMHTASLIHDDVVDNADLRRGRQTINNIRGDFSAVQSGDFLLAKAMELLHKYKGTGINEMLADVSYNMTVGELTQQSMRYKFEEQSVDVYYGLIRKKTALLLSASCWCGAIAGGMDPEKAGRLREYGEKLGIAFQLRDDLIDYTESSGKLPGQDIRNGIFTLPVLTLIERGLPDSVRELLMKREKTGGEVQSLIRYVKDSDVLELVETTVASISREAVSKLQGFTDSREVKALSELVLSLAERQS